jgi:cardiolipin synthase A/B
MCSAAVKTVSRPPRVRHLLAVRLLGLADLVGLAGPAFCASLPTIVPDLARRPGPPVLLAGARGPLAAALSKAILDRLASGGQG